jgi:RNA polymerase sigma-70 factor (ECF subfamily)
MGPHDSFDGLTSHLRDGDPEAARAVFDRFTRPLIALARTELDKRIRQKEDPEDVVQSAYRSLFVRLRDGQLDFSNWGQLWALLTVITRRKCIKRARHYGGQGRDVAREVPLGPGNPHDGTEGLQAIDDAPTPLHGAILADTVETILRGLDSVDRASVEYALQGYSTSEISGLVGLSERSVRRVLERVKRRLVRMREDEAQNA